MNWKNKWHQRFHSMWYFLHTSIMDWTLIVPLPLSKKFHTTSQLSGLSVLQLFAIISMNLDLEIARLKSSNCSEFQNSSGLVEVHCNDLPMNIMTKCTSLKWVRLKLIASKMSILPYWWTSIALNTTAISSIVNSVNILLKHFLNWWIVKRDFIGSWTICNAMSWNWIFFYLNILSSGFYSGWSNLCAPPLWIIETEDCWFEFGTLNWERLFFKLFMFIWLVWPAWMWEGPWMKDGEVAWTCGRSSLRSLFVNEFTPYKKFFF